MPIGTDIGCGTLRDDDTLYLAIRVELLLGNHASNLSGLYVPVDATLGSAHIFGYLRLFLLIVDRWSSGIAYLTATLGAKLGSLFESSSTLRTYIRCR